MAAAGLSRRRESFASEWLWLFALALVPYLFNVESAQHFEPDKAVSVRVLAIGAIAVEGLAALRRKSSTTDLRRMFGHAVTRTGARSVIAAVAALVASTLLSTAISVEPRLSLWGSYERRQGTYTFLSYVALFVIAAVRLNAARVERVLTVVCQTAVAVSIYALVQASGEDPIGWVFDVARRPTSTFGNANALAGYLVMACPFVAFRLARAWRQRSDDGNTMEATPSFDWRRETALVGTHAFLFGNVVLCSRSIGWFGKPARLGLAVGVATSAWALRDSIAFAERRALGKAVLALGALWATLTTGALATGRASPSSGLLLCVLALIPLGTWALRERRRHAVEVAQTQSAAESGARRPARVLGYAAAMAACVTTVVLTQARGAQAALLVSLLVMWNIGPVDGTEATALIGQRTRRRRLVRLGTQAVLALLLLGFNLSQHPLVRRARALPYIGRFGQWLAAGEGTGRERLLIWRGDPHGSGVLGLVSANPLRTTFGYGPETLKEIFARVFPPSLLEGTGHGVTPDRAHQVALDMLYAQGVIGLLAMVATFGSIAWLGLRGLRAGASLLPRALCSAALAAIVAHLIDGAVGIPSTASILMCWTAFAIVVHGNGRAIAPSEPAGIASGDETRPLRSRWGAAARARPSRP